VLAPAPSRHDRMSMHNANKLKIGLFGANCSSGRAVTLVPERWSGSWPDNLKLARWRTRRESISCSRSGAGRLWRRHRLPGGDARDHHLGDGPAGADQTRHRVCTVHGRYSTR